ncbi:MAG: HesA/MoeB/ThiF family protein [Muribaculum sp.]|nr:HesA/MoeB/ThiF family protein [Muribaculum sp.]
MENGMAYFSSDELKRYRGHISLCEVDTVGQLRLKNGRVLIIGAGGLGSPVALYLAAAGVGTIGIMDADTVSLSNLQRQIIHHTSDIGRLKVESARDTMTSINPNINVNAYPTFLTVDNADEIIGNYDITIDCTDNLSARLLINDTCVKIGKPYIYGAVYRFSGQLFTHVPGKATYRDIFEASEGVDERPCAIDGIMNTVVGVIGALQATEAVKWLLMTGDLLTDRILTFDAISMKFNTFDVR